MRIYKKPYKSPLQIKRANNRYGAPTFQSLMPEEYKRWMEEEKNQFDFRGHEFAEKFEQNVKNVFQELESTMMQVRLPTIPGVKYHTGKNN